MVGLKSIWFMDKKKVGIALSGGGARGFAHLGVLKVLTEAKIPIDMFAGTSAGSLVGGALAAGLSVDEVIQLGRNIGWFGLAGFSYSPRGLLSNEPMAKFIDGNFPVKNFEQLTTPFAAVTCDLSTGTEVVMKDSGPLSTAIRASCAIPGVFVPVNDGTGRMLVDGGVVSPMPTRAVKKLGADIVIALDILSCGSSFASSPSTLVGTFIQAAMMTVRTASINQHYRADIVIEPQIAHIRPDEIKKCEELIDLGQQAAREKLDDILRVIEAADRAAQKAI